MRLIPHCLKTCALFVVLSSPGWGQNYVVITGGTGTGSGTFPGELGTADGMGGGTLTFAPSADGAQSTLSAPIMLNNPNAANASTLSQGFTVNGAGNGITQSGMSAGTGFAGFTVQGPFTFLNTSLAGGAGAAGFAGGTGLAINSGAPVSYTVNTGTTSTITGGAGGTGGPGGIGVTVATGATFSFAVSNTGSSRVSSFILGGSGGAGSGIGGAGLSLSPSSSATLTNTATGAGTVSGYNVSGYISGGGGPGGQGIGATLGTGARLSVQNTHRGSGILNGYIQGGINGLMATSAAMLAAGSVLSMTNTSSGAGLVSGYIRGVGIGATLGPNAQLSVVNTNSGSRQVVGYISGGSEFGARLISNSQLSMVNTNTGLSVVSGYISGGSNGVTLTSGSALSITNTNSGGNPIKGWIIGNSGIGATLASNSRVSMVHTNTGAGGIQGYIQGNPGQGATLTSGSSLSVTATNTGTGDIDGGIHGTSTGITIASGSTVSITNSNTGTGNSYAYLLALTTTSPPIIGASLTGAGTSLAMSTTSSSNSGAYTYIGGGATVQDGALLSLNGAQVYGDLNFTALSGGTGGNFTSNVGGVTTIATAIPAGLPGAGNSYGTGSFILDPTSTHTTWVAAGMSPVSVGGNTTLAGTLNVMASYIPAVQNQTFTIVSQTGGPTGSGSYATTTGIPCTVQYLASGVVVPPGTPFDTVNVVTGTFPSLGSSSALTPNEQAVGNYLTSVSGTATGLLAQAVNAAYLASFTGNTGALTTILNQLSNSSYGSLSGVNTNSMVAVTQIGHTNMQAGRMQKEASSVLSASSFDLKRQTAFSQLVTNHTMNAMNAKNLLQSSGAPQRKGVLSQIKPTGMGFTNSPEAINRHQPQAGRIQVGKANVWVQPYGQLVSQRGNINAPGLNSQLGGIALGADYEVTPNTIVGVLGGTSTSPFQWYQNRGSGKMNSGYGGLYAGWKDDSGFYLEGQTIFGGNKFTTNRNIIFPGINQTASASHNAFQFTGNLELGYAVPVYDLLTIQPFIMADYLLMRERGYTETGAGALSMTVQPKTSQIIQPEIGVAAYKTFAIGETLLRPTAELGWVQRHPISNGRVTGGFINQQPSLVVTGLNKVYNQFAPGVGLIAQFKNGLYVSANAYGQVFNGLNIGEALIRVGYEF